MCMRLLDCFIQGMSHSKYTRPCMCSLLAWYVCLAISTYILYFFEVLTQLYSQSCQVASMYISPLSLVGLVVISVWSPNNSYICVYLMQLSLPAGVMKKSPYCASTCCTTLTGFYICSIITAFLTQSLKMHINNNSQSDY